MKTAEQIIEDENVMDLINTGRAPEVIEVIRKYPEQKSDILRIILTDALKRMSDDNPRESRRSVLKEINKICNILEQLTEATEMQGSSPLINDVKSYGSEDSDEMVAEDQATGLRLYNACAHYCRLYTSLKVE